MSTERQLLALKKEAMEIVAAYAGLGVDELASKTRRKPVAQARQIVISLVVDLSGASQSAIGRLFGKDHTTVSYAYHAVHQRSSYPTAEEYQVLQAELVAAMNGFAAKVELTDELLRQDVARLTDHAMFRMKTTIEKMAVTNPTKAIEKVSNLLRAIESPIP